MHKKLKAMIRLKCKQKLKLELKGKFCGGFSPHCVCWSPASLHWPTLWLASGRNFSKIALATASHLYGASLDRISAAAPFRSARNISKPKHIRETHVRGCLIVADKQQELDIPSLRIEESASDGRGPAAHGAANTAANKKKDRGRHVSGTMSHIQGVKRPLCHTNSFTGEKLPKFGVETPHEEELGRVSFFFKKKIKFRIFSAKNIWSFYLFECRVYIFWLSVLCRRCWVTLTNGALTCSVLEIFHAIVLWLQLPTLFSK